MLENNPLPWNIPILSIVVWFPAVGALFIMLFMNKTQENAIKWAANIITFVGFLFSLVLWFYFDNMLEFQFVEKYEWIRTIGVSYHFGLDGISLLLVLMTTLLGFISVLSSWNAITDRVKQYYVFLLLLQTGMLGVFVALDFFLFYVFWEVMLVPMYFLIGVWGGPRKLYAAIKFFLYTLVGSVLILLGILALYFAYGAKTGKDPTFNILELWTVDYDPNLQFWVFLAFFIGFAIKVPMFPFHTWLPDAHVEAPTAGSVILAGVLLKMGTYGFVRLSLPLLPDATKDAVWWVLALSIIGIIYGALVAMVQPDWKKLVAYSSVSHLGFVMLGVFALTHLGIQGGILQMINHGLSTGGLFLIVGIMYEQTHKREIAAYGGIAKVVPVFGALFLVIALASMGLPLLNGFIGEFMILQGAFASQYAGWVYAAFAVSGIVLGAAYLLWLYQRVMFGKLDKPENEKLKDLSWREQATLWPIVALCIFIGVYPKPFLEPLRVPVDAIMDRIEGPRTAGLPPVELEEIQEEAAAH